MSIKSRIDNRLRDSSDWILHSPESLVILMFMGTGMGFLFFGSLAATMGFMENWFLLVLFGIFSLLALKQFVSICTSIKRLGWKSALGEVTAGEFVWSRDKKWKKIDDGGVLDGDSGYENDEGSHKYYEKGNGKIGGEVRDIYR